MAGHERHPRRRALALLFVALALAGCREEEQDRVLIHEKGVYQGAEDEPLDEAQLEQIRQRAQGQKF